MQGKNVISFADASVAWICRRKPRLCASTERAYKGEIDRLAQFFAMKYGGLTLQEFEETHWLDYLREVRGVRKHVVTRKNKSLTPNSAIQAARISAAFLRWARDQGLLAWTPTSNQATSVVTATSLRRRRPLVDLSLVPEPMNPAMAVLLHQPPAANAALGDLRAQLVVCLAYWGGLRSSDIAALRNGHISIDGANVKIRHPRLGGTVTLRGNVAASWTQYRSARENAGGRLKKTSPVISALGSNEPITAWSIWALITKYTESVTGTPKHHSPQALRRARIATLGASYAAGIREVASFTRLAHVDFYIVQ